MERQFLLYTLKVWLGGVLLSTAVVTVIFCIPGWRHSSQATDFISFYCLFAVLEFMFSFFTWLIFWAATMLIIFYTDNVKRRRWLVFTTSITLTVMTFTAFSWLIFSMPLDSISLVLMLINCACIGIGAWLFYPSTTVDTPPPILHEPESNER